MCGASKQLRVKGVGTRPHKLHRLAFQSALSCRVVVGAASCCVGWLSRLRIRCLNLNCNCSD